MASNNIEGEVKTPIGTSDETTEHKKESAIDIDDGFSISYNFRLKPSLAKFLQEFAEEKDYNTISEGLRLVIKETKVLYEKYKKLPSEVVAELEAKNKELEVTHQTDFMTILYLDQEPLLTSLEPFIDEDIEGYAKYFLEQTKKTQSLHPKILKGIFEKLDHKASFQDLTEFRKFLIEISGPLKADVLKLDGAWHESIEENKPLDLKKKSEKSSEHFQKV